MRKIIHIDMDCFYAAVEVKHRPELRGKPLGIGWPAESRGVLCTASYEARKFGVRSAMPSGRAMRLCPQLILIPPNFELYHRESRAVRAILERFTAKIEPLSLDEAYLDVSDSPHFGGSATRIASEIRRLIAEETKLTASAGVAPNKFLAKIASDWKKPNGQFVIRPEDVEAFMKDLKIEKIWGVGQVTAKKMHGFGLKTCADVQKQSVYQLAAWFGSRGEELLELARGIDNRPVGERGKSRSVTVEETYARDLPALEDCLAKIPELFESLEERISDLETSEIRGFVVKLKFHDFKGTTHEMSARRRPEAADFRELLEHAWQRRAEPVRLIGLGVRLAAGRERDSGPQLSFPFP